MLSTLEKRTATNNQTDSYNHLFDILMTRRYLKQLESSQLISSLSESESNIQLDAIFDDNGIVKDINI